MAKKTSTLTPAAEAQLRGLRFIDDGTGRHISGVPRRDVTPDEVGQLTIKQIEAAIGSGLYELDGGSSNEL